MGLITPREYDVLIRLHKNNQQIADELGIEMNTVRVVIANLRKKFKVKTRSAIIVRAIRFGIVDIKSFSI